MMFAVDSELDSFVSVTLTCSCWTDLDSSTASTFADMDGWMAGGANAAVLAMGEKMVFLGVGCSSWFPLLAADAVSLAIDCEGASEELRFTAAAAAAAMAAPGPEPPIPNTFFGAITVEVGEGAATGAGIACFSSSSTKVGTAREACARFAGPDGRESAA